MTSTTSGLTTIPPAREDALSATDPAQAARAPRILLYSDDATVREQVRLAVGRRVDRKSVV